MKTISLESLHFVLWKRVFKSQHAYFIAKNVFFLLTITLRYTLFPLRYQCFPLSLKCKISGTGRVEKVYILYIFNCYRANINGMWKARKLSGIYNAFKFRLNEHLIVLNLYSVSINKILVMEIITAKSSQNLNLV